MFTKNDIVDGILQIQLPSISINDELTDLEGNTYNVLEILDETDGVLENQKVYSLKLTTL